MAVKLHSFDVFDTCLVRSCPFPSDVFRSLAEAFRKSLAPRCGPSFVEDFQSARVRAEEVVRSRTSSEDISLSDIWRELASALPIEGLESGAQCELEAEADYIRANHAVLRMVDDLRACGARLAFISDTYLPGRFVREQLRRLGFFRDGDGLYVSCEVGLTKQTGNLYKHVLAAESIAPGSMRHLGDNALSDVRVPRALGIDAFHYGGSSFNSCERAVLNGSLNHRASVSKLVGRCRVFRVSGPPSSDDGRSFVASFLGPLLVTFASWVLATARHEGVRRLYFASRDCYLLWRTATILAPQFGVEARYLHVSRQALQLPSAKEISPSGMPWLRQQFDPRTIETVLAKLDLLEAGVETTVRQALGAKDEKYSMRGDEEWGTFWRTITNGQIRTVLESKIRERRDAALCYLRSQGLTDPVRWALVDLGWLLTCQTSLCSILGSSRENAVHGYYLGLRQGRDIQVEVGSAKALFYEEPGDRASLLGEPAVFSRIVLLEHTLGIAPHGSVHHYRREGSAAAPVCRPFSASELELVRKIEPLLDTFATLNAGLTSELSCAGPAREVIDGLLRGCFENPLGEWSELVRAKRIAVDQNYYGDAPMAWPLSWTEFAASCIPGRFRSHGWPDRPWMEASELVSPAAIRKGIRMRDAVRAAMHAWKTSARLGR
jgi:predicted HAD superfamily hydrolase